MKLHEWLIVAFMD